MLEKPLIINLCIVDAHKPQISMKSAKSLLKIGKSNFKMCPVTPTLAQKLLLLNKKNRPLKIKHVKWLATQMRRGLWKFNGDTIRFDESGKLSDGQHRLHAVIESGLTQTFLVVIGLEKTSMATIDTGMIRGAGDVLGINGFKYSALMASTVKTILKVKSNNFSRAGVRGNSAILLSNQVILDFATKNTDYLEEVCAKAAKLNQEFKLLTPTFYAANYYNMSLQNKGKADEFFRALTEGTNIQKNSAIYQFRKKLIDTKVSDSKLSNKSKYFYLYSCWNAFLQDKEMKRLPTFSASATIDTGEIK